jgi:enolase-phosphatase E1
LQFPYALDKLPAVLDEQWDSPAFSQYRFAFPAEYQNDRTALEAHVRDLVARDVKIAYLKGLQGYLWKYGYSTGEIKAPLYADVAPFMKACNEAGKKIIIYSSGSVPAQKLLFGHTDAEPADLQPLIADWFDTVNAGLKTESDSYRAILSKHPDVASDKWLFLSDNLAEVKAALAAGIKSLPVSRPGNNPLPADDRLSGLAIPDFTPQTAATERKTMQTIGSVQH